MTDAAGKWKQFTNDVEGNLISVVEPDPANLPNGTATTSYTYDWMNHVTQVSMPRGSATQTRTFVYSDAGLLTSATNPENGTVTYTYNANNTLQYKHDAQGQDTVYTYDTKNRVTMVQRYPTGQSHSEDVCQRLTYTYDTNPVSGSFSQYSQGRLTTAQYSTCAAVATHSVTEMYSYHAAGAVTSKRMDWCVMRAIPTARGWKRITVTTRRGGWRRSGDGVERGAGAHVHLQLTMRWGGRER